jgi:hypothetical protein
MGRNDPSDVSMKSCSALLSARSWQASRKIAFSHSQGQFETNPDHVDEEKIGKRARRKHTEPARLLDDFSVDDRRGAQHVGIALDLRPQEEFLALWPADAHAQGLAATTSWIAGYRLSRLRCVPA